MSGSLTSRENQFAEAFVSLTDTLVNGFDVADLFYELAMASVRLLGASAAGLMLVDADGRLRVMAASSEQARLLELMQLQHDEGACLDAHRTGRAVFAPDLDTERGRWPTFTEEALRVGYRSVYALPMRLRDDVLGALNLFHREAHGLDESTLRLGQALADVATIGILQARAAQSREQLSSHLQVALNTRVVIEQAKGVLSVRLDLDMVDAFEALRRYARTARQPLSAVADAVVAGTLDPSRFAGTQAATQE